MPDFYRDNPELRHLFVRKCRSCDQEIDMREFGPDKICPLCGKISAPANIRQAHVVFRRIEYGNVGRYINGENGKILRDVDYKEFLLSYILDISNIENPPFSNGHLYNHWCFGMEGWEERTREELADLEELEKDVELYLWVSDQDANSYLNMLWFAPWFLRFDKVYLVSTYTEEDMKSEHYFPGDSLKRKRLLGKEELRAMSDEFRCSCGSEYRIRRNGELLHYDFEDLAAIALSGAGEEFLFFNVLYARAHDRLMERDGAHFPWEVFEIVMWELLKQGRIESSSPRELWGDEWFAALGEGHFRLAPKASNRRRSKLKLLRILRDALAYGSTTALYGALAEEVSLEGTPRDTRGREEVVHAIECWGVYLDHYCKEKIECLLCKEKNMIDRTSPNQLCLLWSSEGAEGKQHYFVYADVSGGRIDRIRFLSPDPSVMLYPIYDDEN